ncbi:MAG: hypothetical protein C0623_03130 [Desulfuromonas sp.]|nr:MAG: hypothetical protein C0623_03130 [Desulfuromonas sp.]
MTGSVLKKDGTAAVGAYVYAYRSAKNGLRGPADFAARVDSAGNYFLDLVEGDYHLVARLRKKGADSGPPRPGDAWALFAKNPLTIGAAKVEQVNFLLQGGALPRQARKGSLTSGDTGFTGLLVDQNREPQSGALALAYRTAEFHRMPDWTSMPAGPGGRFTLFVPNGGVYCLAARMSSRGQPRAGEPYGRLGPGEESCREISDGEMLEVGEIVLQPYR